ncbi:MAG: hypothetical protein ACRCZ2_08080 [Fusobacteriaceae bacterium]
MENKILRIQELLKEWYGYGLIKADPSKWTLGISKISKSEWLVSIDEMGAEEHGYTLNGALKSMIKSLEEDEDYLYEEHRHHQTAAALDGRL